jgi:hypothetical protein
LAGTGLRQGCCSPLIYPIEIAAAKRSDDSGNVKNDICTGHCCTQFVHIVQADGDRLNVERLQESNLRRGTDQATHAIAAANEFFHEVRADEAGATSSNNR